MAQKKAETGRPSTFTTVRAAEICDWIASGKSLRSYCEQEGTPQRRTVMKWLSENEGFRAQYAQAREDQAESYADKIVDIADNMDIPPEHKRLMIDARKWTASKLLPKKYGDKQTTEVTGANGGPLTIVVNKVSKPSEHD